jgi:NAD(P)H dehydrogenase (quinone)
VSTGENLYLVTGATGNTGLPTVEFLRAAGHRVRALVHSLDDRSQSLVDLGAEVVEGDLLDFASVGAATAGVHAAYFCYPIAPGNLLTATALFAQAASEAGVHAIVNMSQISARREARSNTAREHWIAERLLDRTAIVTTHLRPTFFMEWLGWYLVRRGDEGIFRLPFADARFAPIHGRDQAKVIAAILQNPDPHDRQIYPLFGTEELDYHQIATKVAATLGIAVHYEPIEIEQFARGLRAGGATENLIQHLSSVAQDFRDGIFAGTNNLVEAISGSRPWTVEDYVNATREQFDTSGYYAITDDRLPVAL